MLAIGNEEKCPYCELVCHDGNIDGKEVIDHLVEKHSKEFAAALKEGPHVNKDGVFT